MATPGSGVQILRPNAPPTQVRQRDGRRASYGRLSWIGDTLAVDGWQSWRLFSPSGNEVGCRRFEHAHNEFIPQILEGTPLPGGLTLGEFRPAYPGQGISIPLVVSRDQHIIRTLAVAPPEPRPVSVRWPHNKGASSQLQPGLEARPLWAAADNGSGVVWIEQPAPSARGTVPVEVRWIEVSGRIRYRTALEVPVLAMSAAWKNQRAREWAHPGATDQRTAEETAALARAFRKAVLFPDYHAPVANVVAGADGTAWLRLATESEAATWLHLDVHGHQVRRAVLPARFIPMYADAAGLWGAMEEPGGLRVLLVGPQPVAYAWPELPPAPEPVIVTRLWRGCDQD
ncbi:MAG TPA: hypothetical protein VF665_08020 [Longimicrobium sp.]|uniref:hypothetical protein n=1 Tax=Longimicrobium sp. TaxID=2029185 RepID=UPI002EDA6528